MTYLPALSWKRTKREPKEKKMGYQGNDYGCTDCDKSFRHRTSRNEHIKVVHGNKKYPCNVCGKEFRSSGFLTGHMNMHMGLKPFQCDKCDSAFASMDCLCKHKRFRCKGAEMEATCPICGKELPKKNALEMHMKNHTKAKGQNFSPADKNEAVALAQTIGLGPAAEQLGLREETLSCWRRTVTAPVHCEVCGHVTYSLYRLNRHMKSHDHDRPFRCDLQGCQHRSKSAADLRKHSTQCKQANPDLSEIEASAEVTTEENCKETGMEEDGVVEETLLDAEDIAREVCTKKVPVVEITFVEMAEEGEVTKVTAETVAPASKPAAMEMPVLKVEDVTVEDRAAEVVANEVLDTLQNMDIVEEKYNIKKFIKTESKKAHCEDCGKEFSSKPAVNIHRKATHEGMKWYCDQCSLSFKRSNCLVRHVDNVHTEKILQCDQCEKGSYTKRGLLYHVKYVHKGIKHPCDQCGKTFTASSTMRAHVRNIHEGHVPIRANREKCLVVCSDCDGVYNSKDSLRRHFREKHEGITYNCDVCDYKATQKVNLTGHKQKKHRIQNRTAPALQMGLVTS
jgi:KRAB domain-containing zinc finger protein